MILLSTPFFLQSFVSGVIRRQATKSLFTAYEQLILISCLRFCLLVFFTCDAIIF